MKKGGIILMALIIIAVHVMVLFLAISPQDAGSVSNDSASTAEEEYTEPEPDPGEKTDDTASVQRETEQTEAISPALAVPEKTAAQPAAAKPEPEPEKISNTLRGTLYRGKNPVLDRSKAVRTIPGLPIAKTTFPQMTGILIDLKDHRVLWQKDSLKKVPIASLTKIMTLVVVYEEMLKGSPLTMSTRIPITTDARQVPPSGVAFTPEEKSFPLQKLMLASAVKSANDATYLIAQAFSNGDVDQFVKKMNQRADELGMNKTTFHNPHGLPGKNKAADNQSTATAIARLCEVYLSYPELNEWASMREAAFRKPNDLVNHNNLLPGGKYACKGVSGIKTGFTNRAGFCVAAICTREGRTLLAVVTGFTRVKERDTFVRSLFEWGFKQK